MQMGRIIQYGVAWLLIAVALPAWATPVEVAKIRKGIPHEALLAIAFDGDKGLSVGAGGALMSTEDGGATWKPEASPTKLSLTAVAIKGHRRVIAGQVGEIFFDDGTGKWQKANSGTKERVLGVAINANGVALAVGSFGLFIRSGDGGRTWEHLNANWDPLFAEAPDLGEGFQPQLYGVQINDEGIGIAVGEFETIIRSEDSGLTWRAVMVGDVLGSDRPPTLFAVKLNPDQGAYAVGQSGVIVTSKDAGRTWCRTDSGTTTNLFDIASFSNGTVVVSGMRKMLYGGGLEAQGWDVVDGEDLSFSWYSGVATNGRGDVIAVGQAGSILKISH